MAGEGNKSKAIRLRRAIILEAVMSFQISNFLDCSNWTGDLLPVVNSVGSVCAVANRICKGEQHTNFGDMETKCYVIRFNSHSRQPSSLNSTTDLTDWCLWYVPNNETSSTMFVRDDKTWWNENYLRLHEGVDPVSVSDLWRKRNPF